MTLGDNIGNNDDNIGDNGENIGDNDNDIGDDGNNIGDNGDLRQGAFRNKSSPDWHSCPVVPLESLQKKEPASN